MVSKYCIFGLFSWLKPMIPRGSTVFNISLFCHKKLKLRALKVHLMTVSCSFFTAVRTEVRPVM